LQHEFVAELNELFASHFQLFDPCAESTAARLPAGGGKHFAM